MSKVTLSGHIEVPAAELEAVRDALAWHIELTKAELGCLIFEVTEHPTESGRFDVYEEFNSKAAFESHQKRVRESNWGKVATNVRRCYTIEGLGD